MANVSKIFRLVAGVKGESITAARRTPSAAAASTPWRRGEAAPSSLRIFHGSCDTTWPLIAVRSLHTASSARLNWHSPIAARHSASAPRNAAWTSLSAAIAFGVPPKDWRQSAATRDTVLPRSLARSALNRVRNASSEKLASWPNAISRRRKYRSASAPKSATRWSGRTTLPTDLETFFASRSHQPCAQTVVGSGSPAESRNAGQYTVWKRRMSLPMKWTRSASGWSQNSRKRVSSPDPNPRAVM